MKIDTGNTGSEGPWIAWSARGTLDGSIPAKTFFLRDGDGKKPIDLSRGVVLDLDTLKTGWQRSEGVVGQAPDWKWNASPEHMMAQPGDDYKKGFSVRVAYSKTDAATWEQAGAAVWSALVDLAPQFEQRPGNKLPVVKHTGARFEQYKRGSTTIPTFELVRWTDRPAALAAAPIATEPTPAPAPQPAAQPAQAPVMAGADDEDEFI